MKKFTLLVTALAISLVTFAQGKITYELNGGVTNDYGWQDKQDIYETLNADWNAHSGTSTIWKTLAELNGDVTLYTNYVEYIPSIKEVIALEDSTETKVQGTVTYVAGTNFWIQDATGGILCYGKDNGLTEGELVTLSGEKVIYKGSPELTNATVVVKETGAEVGAQTILISALYADSLKNYKTYLNELIYLEGVTISRYEDEGIYKTPYITDGFNEIQLYKWDGFTEDKYPVGTKVSLKAVLSIYKTTFLLRGKEEWITEVVAAGLDPYEYPEVEAGDYKFNLTSDWLYSNNLGNWWENRPNPVPQGSRSVVEKGGILYFAYRNANTPTEKPKLVRVDAKTGKMLEPVIFADNMFKDVNGEWLFGPYTDLKLDNAGNAITSNLPTEDSAPFQIWNVDLETGEGKLIIDLATDTNKWLRNQFPENTTIRLDRIGVYGDINGDATIMSVVSAGADVYYWTIEDGEWDGETNWIKLGLGEGVNVGGAPVICPIEGNYFYVDGFNTYPLVFDLDGNLVDAFDADHEADRLLIGANGVKRDTGHNGVTEFEVNGEYYLIIAGDNTYGYATAPSTFVLYKFADENREFKDMTQLYEFPMEGMGANSNPQRVATSFAKPNEDGTAVDIYVFTAENGYGKYTLSIEDAETSYNIETYSNDESCGTVIGGGTYLEGDSATLIATAFDGYDFDYWEIYSIELVENDWGTYYEYVYQGTSTNDTITFVVDKNYAYNAYFKVAPVLIDGVYYELKNNLTAYVYPYEYTGDIVIPSSVVYKDKNYGVVGIYEDAFAGTSITSLTVSNGLNSINLSECDNLVALRANIDFIEGCGGLNSLKNLREIYVTSGTLVTGDVVYFNFLNLLQIPGLEVLDLSKVENTELSPEMFKETYVDIINDYYAVRLHLSLKNLRKLVLPEGLKKIHERQFEGLWLLEEIVIPEGVTEIPDGAFYDCHALAKVEFSENIASIGNYAFYSCHALENIVIPEGVTEIGNAAFYGCTYLENIELPSTLNEIGNNAFALSSKVRKIKAKAHTPPALWAKTFYDVDRNTPVYVAEVAYDDYVADQYWGEFFNIIATPEYNEDPTGVENTDESSVVIYTQNGMLYEEGLSVDYQVFDVNGRLIYVGCDAQLSLPRGVYVVVVGGEVEKVVI